MSIFKFKSLLTKLTNSKKKRSRSNRRKDYATFESLEPRQLLAGITFQSNVITIDGSSVRDVAIVELEGSNVKVSLSRTATQLFTAAQVARIVFNGGNGNDFFRNDTGIPSEAFGGNGSDTLIGGGGADVLRGGSGNDKLYGRAGNDQFHAGTGFDKSYGGSGIDVANYTSQQSSYQFRKQGEFTHVIFSSGRSELTSGIDTFQFSNGSIEPVVVVPPVSGSGGGGSAATENGAFTASETRSRDLMNNLRQSQGRPTLAANDALNTFAENWSRQMINIGLTHSADADLTKVGADNGFTTKMGENVVWVSGNLTRDQAMAEMHRIWSNSQVHRANILDTSFTAFGVGIAFGNGRWYGTHIFAG